ncbi:DUF3265 domain-containing protein [Aeromonas dhakensis]|nr:DUF3265 domain-containing protein [Aeromonas dhakensis]
MTKRSIFTRNKWHFHYALDYVIKVVFSRIGIASLHINKVAVFIINMR